MSPLNKLLCVTKSRLTTRIAAARLAGGRLLGESQAVLIS
jgi:hypothetical protein